MNLASLLSAGWSPTVLLVIKATLILLVAVALAASLRRASADTRHLIWLVAIGAVLMLPVLAGWTPLDLRVLPATPALVIESTVAASGDAIVVTSSDAAGPRIGAAQSSQFPANSTSPAVTDASNAIPFGFVLFAIWGIVALLLVGRLIHGTIAVRRIVNRATPLADDDWQSRLYDVADRLGIMHAPRVVSSDEIRVPFAAGFLRATIVLPAECDTWTPGQRDAVLIHELGHVRRRDLLGHTLGRVACALYWFHPLVWTAARRLRDASERACDDLAIRLGSRPSEYAEHLLEIVTATGRRSVPGVALAMAQRKEFEGRMLAILDPALRREVPARWKSATLTAALTMLCLIVAAAAPAPRQGGGAGARIEVTTSATDAGRESDTGPGPNAGSAPLSVASPDSSFHEGTPQASPQNPAPHTSPQDAMADISPQDSVPLADPRPALHGAPPRARPESLGGVIENALLDAVRSFQGVQPASGSPDVLARVLRNDSSARVRRTAAWGLKQHADVPVANAALRDAVASDPDARVRSMAIWAIEASRDPVVVPVIGNVLNADADADVREMAAWALGQSGDPDGVPFLADQLGREQSGEVLGTIAWALGAITPESAPAPLAGLLINPSDDVRLKAAWALSQIADPDALPAIRAAIDQPQEARTMRALLRAWVRMDGTPEGLTDLIDASDPEVRRAAVRALAGDRWIDPWPWPWPRPIISP